MKLLEANTSVDIEWVKKNCSEAIEQYKKGNIIYKGMEGKYQSFTLRSSDRIPRRARNTDHNLHNDLINNHPMFKGYPKREHICSSDRKYASIYGNPYIILPVNGAKIGMCSDRDLWESFENISDEYSNILDLYNGLHSLSVDIGIGVDIDDYSDLRDIVLRLTDIANEYSESIEEDTSEEDIGEAVDDYMRELISNSIHSRYVTDLFLEAIATNVGALLEIFEPIGWEIQNINNLDLHSGREVWTDSDIVIVEYVVDMEQLIDRHINESVVLNERQLQLPLKDNGHIIILAGSPGSGKSYSIENFTNITDHSSVLDVDEIKNHVRKSTRLRNDFKKWLKVAARGDYLYQNLTDIEILDDTIMRDTTFNNYIHDFVSQSKYLYKKLDMVGKSEAKKNVVIDGTLRHIPSTEKKVNALIDDGYTKDKVHLVYVYAPLGLSLSRNNARPRSASADFVRGAYADVMDNLMGIIRSKKMPSGGTGSFSIIVNEEGTNTSNLKYYRVMKDGKWDDVNIKKFIAKVQDDINTYKREIAITNNPNTKQYK